MKVLITTDDYYIKANSIVLSISNLYEELTIRGHEVRILSFSKEGHSHEKRDIYYLRALPLEHVSIRGKRPCKRCKELSDILSWKPDVIHSLCEFLSYSFALKIARTQNCPIVHSCYRQYEAYSEYLSEKSMLKKTGLALLAKHRLRYAKTLICSSRKTKEMLISHGFKQKIEILPSSLRFSSGEMAPDKAQRAEIREKLSINEEDIVLACFDRLDGNGSLEEMLLLFQELVPSYRNVKLLVAGRGQAEVEALASKLGIMDKIRFISIKDKSGLSQCYQASDILVSASTSESRASLFVGALSNGLPLLCKRAPIFEDIIEAGVNGYAYESAEEYKTNLGLMIEDSKWREAASKESMKKAKDYDKSYFGERIERIYLAAKGD